MSKILIENYRGFDIEFDTTHEKFQCIVTDENTKESSSFTAVKKFIDDYKKTNTGFIPFVVVPIPAEYGREYLPLKIIGIRKDGRFIAEKNGEQIQVSDYDIKSYMLQKEENALLMSELKSIESKRNEANQAYRAAKNDIISRMNIVNLADYKKTII